MKKLFGGIGWIAIIFLASCTGGTVDGITPDNQGKWITVSDSAGKVIGTKEIFPDTTIYVRAYFSQKVKIAAHHGGLAVFAIFGILGAAFLIFGFAQTFKAQKRDATLLVYPIVGIICGIIAFGSVEWARGKDVPLPKTIYDSITVNHGDLKSAIEPLIYK